jgi:Protein of unknown function (DUF2924)
LLIKSRRVYRFRASQIAELGRMTVTQLRQKYMEVFGEETRSNNRQFPYRRVAWRITAKVKRTLDLIRKIRAEK